MALLENRPAKKRCRRISKSNGFERWDPPDAGANQSIPEAGGGITNNDGRIMESKGEAKEAAEGAMQYLDTVAGVQQPFFLVISLVNPHDVLFYPSRTFEESAYDDSWLAGDIEVPPTNGEELATKPSVQEEFLKIFNLTGKPRKDAEKRVLPELLREPDALLGRTIWSRCSTSSKPTACSTTR